MATVEDIRLVELAADRPAELFPTLHRASALRPLLVVLCTLPGLYALVHGACDNADALWGMRTLPLLQASNVEEFVDPSCTGPELTLKWQPLLGNWLASFGLKLTGTAYAGALYVVPYLSTMLLVVMCYVIFYRVSGARIAFWIVLLAAFHGSINEHVTHHAPYALAVALAMGTFWGFLGHLQRGNQTVSFDLLVGGVLLGLCTLAGGPLSLAVVLILLLHVLGLRGEKSTVKRGRDVRQRRVWVGWPALKSLSICCLTAFAVGGWWVLMMRYTYGQPFWSGWLAGSQHGEIDHKLFLSGDPAESFLEKAARQFAGITGMVVGIAILGICCAVRELLVQEDEQRRRQWQFLVAWWGCALVMFLSSVRTVGGASVSGPLWQLFLLVPSIGSAGLALDEIARRRVRLETVVGLTLIPLFLGYLLMQSGSAQILPSFGGLLLWVFAGGTLIWGAGKLCEGNEPRRQALLATLVIAHLLANGAASAWSVRRATDESRALAAFRASLSSQQDVDKVFLLADAEPPLPLQYSLRSLWPAAETEIIMQSKAVPTSVVWSPEQFAVLSRPLVVDWTEKDTRAESSQPDEELRSIPVVSPQFYAKRALRAYRLEWIRKE